MCFVQRTITHIWANGRYPIMTNPSSALSLSLVPSVLEIVAVVMFSLVNTTPFGSPVVVSCKHPATRCRTTGIWRRIYQ